MSEEQHEQHEQQQSEHVRIVVDRREVTALSRQHRRVFVEWSDRNGVRCCTTGYIAQLDASVLTIEAGGKSTAISLARIHAFEVVGSAKGPT